MNVEQLNSALGAYYRQQSRVIDDVMLQGFESASTYGKVNGVVDEYVTTTKGLEKILQPYLRGFTPHVNKLRFVAEKNYVHPAKIDYEINSEDIRKIEKSALGYMLEGSSSNPTDLPQGIASMVINSMLDRADNEMEFDVHYKGVYVEPTYPNPGEPSQTTDGIEKKLDDAIAAGKLLPFALGDFGDADVLDYIEEFVLMLPEMVKRQRIFLDIDMHLHEMYWINRRTKFNLATDYNPNQPLQVLNYPNITLRAIPGMGRTKRIITTVPGNKIMLSNRTGEERMLRIVYKEDERAVRMVSDFKIGFGFRTFGIPYTGKIENQVVFTNDVK